MKVDGIFVGTTVPMGRLGIESFGESEWAKKDEAKILAALWAEKVWSGDFAYSAFLGFSDDVPYLSISHPAFQSEIRIDISNDLTVDGVEKAVLAHIATHEEVLQKEISTRQDKSTALKKARSEIFRAKVKAEVVARFPEAATFQYFSQSDIYGYHCFVSEDGLARPIYVVRLNQGYPASIARLDLDGFEWHHLDSSHKRRLFWAAIARAYVESGGLQKIHPGSDEEVFMENPGGVHIVEKVVFETPGPKPTTICVSFHNNQPVDTVRADYPYTVE